MIFCDKFSTEINVSVPVQPEIFFMLRLCLRFCHAHFRSCLDLPTTSDSPSLERFNLTLKYHLHAPTFFNVSTMPTECNT